MTERNRVRLLYDGGCPVCAYYARHVDLADNELVRVDAREPGALRDEVTAAGIDINEGMVLQVGDTLYVGSDALHQLALQSSGGGLGNRISAALFRRPRLARTLYPFLARCRSLLLAMLGRPPIQYPGDDKSPLA